MKICPQCKFQLPDHARFCLNCGAEQPVISGALPPEQINWSGSVVQQVYDRLLLRLKDRVTAEQDDKRAAEYQERLYSSGYREIVQRRIEQWVTEWEEKSATEKTAAPQSMRYLIDDLLDFFFIIHCGDLNEVVLPETILRHQQSVDSSIDAKDLALDYLDFDREEERVYLDFITLPVKKIRNAGKSFLFPERDEKIWFICDQSFLGNAKEGFAMTEKALYWKSGFQGAQRVYYHKLFSLQKEKEWLLINDLYFNATPSLNTKMIWLIRKLARLHRANL
ncbi:MAG: zinc ribbon domain-containing protein [Bacteroidota bacterium]